MSAPRVLVTGGGRGIGRAIALRFAREGASVVVAARTSPELDAVAAEIDAAGGRGMAAQVNVADEGSVEAAVWRAVEFCGGVIDVLVNCAGTFAMAPFEKTTSALWERHIGVNLTGAFYVTKETLQYLQESERSHVFNIASVAARKAFPENTAYCASKFGLRGFSDALRLDLAGDGIRVSTVYPGPTETGMIETIEGVDRSNLLQPEDVAEVVWQAYAAEGEADVSDLDVGG